MRENAQMFSKTALVGFHKRVIYILFSKFSRSYTKNGRRMLNKGSLCQVALDSLLCVKRSMNNSKEKAMLSQRRRKVAVNDIK